MTTAIALVLAAPVWAGTAKLDDLRHGTEFDQFIIKHKQDAPERADAGRRQQMLDRVASAVTKARGKGAQLRHLRAMALGADVLRTDRKLDRKEAEILMRRIAAEPGVEYVEIDVPMHAFMKPSDPQYVNQWSYRAFSPQAYGQLVGINAEKAWDMATGSGVNIAVIDTGWAFNSDVTHGLRINGGYDFISDVWLARDGDGREEYYEDSGTWGMAGECDPSQPTSSWHGTHVLGIAGANTNNGRGVAGTAPDAHLTPIRVLGRCGKGVESDITDAIVWAAGGSVPGVPANTNPAEVINLSLGGLGTCSAAFQQAIDWAVSRGTTVVVAAGNSDVDVANVQPASCNNVIVVGAVDGGGYRPTWSNHGALVDIAAPGARILSTINHGTTAPGAPADNVDTYVYKDGTSMAAPFVSGVVALIQSVAATPKTPAEIEALLKSTAHAFPQAPDKPLGAGILDAAAAVATVAAPAQPSPPSSVVQMYSYTLSWQSSPGAVRYVVEELVNGEWVAMYDGPNLSWTATEKPKGTYKYRLKVCTAVGCSAYSAETSVVVGADMTPILMYLLD